MWCTEGKKGQAFLVYRHEKRELKKKKLFLTYFFIIYIIFLDFLCAVRVFLRSFYEKTGNG